MNRYKLFALFLIFPILFVGVSCEDQFAEINVDPDDPTQTSANFLFNGILSSLPYINNEKLYLNNQRMYQWSQLSASLIDEPNEINDLGRDPVWNSLFGSIRNIRELEKRLDEYTGDQERTRNRRALLKILFAYKTFRVTDLYGDMPYTEAGQGVNPDAQIFRPKYDSQESIYKAALDDLMWASDNLVTDGSLTPGGESYFNFGSNETLFNNDMAKWQKLANALLLRYALRMSNADQAGASAIISNVLGGGKPLPEGHDDMFAFSPSANGVGANQYWAFQFYEGIRMGENIFSQMTENTNPDGSGIIDPRVYVYFEPNDSNEWVAAPQSPAARDAGDQYGHPYITERRPDPATFENRGHYSGFNFYLVEDTDNGTEFHLGYPELCFLVAESYQRGFANGNAQEWYEKGIRASIEKWYTFGLLHPDYVDPPAMPSDSVIDAFIAHPQVAYNAGEGLKLIHTQRWLDLMMQPQEAFHLVRRSGLIPELPVVNAVNGSTEPMPRRLKYPEDERNNNLDNYEAHVRNMNGGDEFTSRMWWDNK